MVGIGDRGQYGADAGGMSAIPQDGSQMGDLEAMGIGLKNVVGTESVDGNEQQRAGGEPRGRQDQ